MEPAPGDRLPDAERLSHIYFLKNVPRLDLVELCQLAPPERFQAGDTLFRQGDPADVALLVVEGRLVVSVRVGEVVRQVGDVRSGEVVGEVALFNDRGRRSATVVATEPGTALKISWYLLEKAPTNRAVTAIEQQLLGTLVRRIRRTNQAIQGEWRSLADLPPAKVSSQAGAAQRKGLLERIFSLFGGST